MKLGFFIEPTGAGGYYRVIIPMLELERRGHTVVWVPDAQTDAPMAALSSCELVHCYRRFDKLDQLRRLSELGVAISFDNDDDFEALTVTAEDSGKITGGLKSRRHNAKAVQSVARILQFADLVTTPSAVLVEKYRDAGGAHVALIENHLDEGMRCFGARGDHDGIVVGWVAGLEHAADLPQLTVVKALAQLLEQRADLRVQSFGVRLPLNSDRYEHRANVDYYDLLEVIGKFDIGIAPLADTAFNRARSNVKLKEYGAGGAPWLASPVGPYAAMGEREGGRTVGDEHWPASLDELISSERKRKRLSRRGLKWAKSQTIARHVSVWEDEFASAIERAGVRLRESRRVLR